MLRRDPVAESLAVSGFSDVDEAARGHAYLSGFLLQLLADERGETAAETCSYVRTSIT